jgi:hypothetical protein
VWRGRPARDCRSLRTNFWSRNLEAFSNFRWLAETRAGAPVPYQFAKEVPDWAESD